MLVSPLSPIFFGHVAFAAGVVILASALTCMESSYKRPVYFFLLLSAAFAYQYQLPLSTLVAGVRSMLPIVAIVAVLQIFIVPIAVGRYDLALRQYLREHFRSGGSLSLFLHLATHIFGALLSLGAVPLVFSIFNGSISGRVNEYKRFIVTAESRGFAMSTIWAPGAASVMLAMQATGAEWFGIFACTSGLAIAGIITSVFMEKKLQAVKYRDRPAPAMPEEGGDSGPDRENTKKVGTLLFAAAAMILLITVMEQAHIWTNPTRILTACLTVCFFWVLRYYRHPGLKQAWQGFWGNACNTLPGLAALFISMGIFSEAVDQSGLLSDIFACLTAEIGAFGKYVLFFVPPFLLLISGAGIHPFVSLMILGKILNAALGIPHQDILIAFSLVLGGALSYIASPFTGTVLILSSLTDSSPRKVAFNWNGLFAAVFLLEGLAALFLIQLFLL